MPCGIQDSRFIVGFQVTRYEKKLYPEYQFHLALEIGREDAFAEIFKDFVPAPETPAVELVTRDDLPIVHRAVDIDQFALALRAEHVHRHAFGTNPVTPSSSRTSRRNASSTVSP